MCVLGWLAWTLLIFLLLVSIVILKDWKWGWYSGVKVEIFLSGNFSLKLLGCESRGDSFTWSFQGFCQLNWVVSEIFGHSASLRVESSLYEVPFMPHLPSIKAFKVSLKWDTGLYWSTSLTCRIDFGRPAFDICLFLTFFPRNDNIYILLFFLLSFLKQKEWLTGEPS